MHQDRNQTFIWDVSPVAFFFPFPLFSFTCLGYDQTHCHNDDVIDVRKCKFYFDCPHYSSFSGQSID